MRMLGGLLLASVLCVQVAQGAPAGGTFRGAEALLQQLAEQETERTSPRNHRALALQKDLASFRAERSRLSPSRAAERWLELADRYLALPPEDAQPGGDQQEPLDFALVLRSLPPPAAWDDLAGRLLTRLPPGPPKTFRHWSWAYLRHCLLGDLAGCREDLNQLAAVRSLAPPEETPAVTLTLLMLCEELQKHSNEPEQALRILELRLAHQTAADWSPTVALPDLVSLLGATRAEQLLRRMLIGNSLELEVPEGGPTLKLAQRVALAELPRLKVPQWGLVRSFDAIPLFQAMERRFAGVPAKPHLPNHRFGLAEEGAPTSYTAAQLCYAFSLVAARNPALAAERMPRLLGMLDSASATGWGDRLRRAGREAELVEFLRLTLAQSPELPLWDYYVPLALRHGRAAELVNRLQTLLAGKTLTPQQSLKLRLLLTDVLLASDRPEAAAAELRKAMTVQLEQDRSSAPTPFDAALRLARLGRVLGKEAWVADGLRFASKAVAESSPFDLRLDGLLQILDEFGRWSQAEQLLFEVIARDIAQEAESPLGASQLPDRLTELAGLYHSAGRQVDVLRLVDGATAWGVGDLRGTLLAVDYRDHCLGFMVASALSALGRGGEAGPILEAVLRERVDYDPAYELLVRLQGERSLPFLEMLARENRVEKRPLLWQAQVLLKAGRLDAAERAVRTGITLDPSDSDQLFGRRMRGYVILADICEARGDAPQAKQHRDRVRAVRLGEEAEKLELIGLRKMAIERSREAISICDQVPSLQMSLAGRLARLGRGVEAEAYYRTACELYAEGLGRRSDLLLNPDDAGDWKRGVAIAEEVFLRQAALRPEKPQPQFLMATLRMTESRPADALRHYWKVVERDPDYIAGWIAIQICASFVTLPAADRETAAAELLRLDPLSQASIPDLGAFTDLRRLWTAVEKAQAVGSGEERGPIYPLTAARAALKTEAERHPERLAQRRQMELAHLWRSRTFRLDRNGAGSAPSEQLVVHGLIGVLATGVDGVRAARLPQ